MKIYDIIMNLRSEDENKILQTATMAADALELLEERISIIAGSVRQSAEIMSSIESWIDEI